MSNKFSGKVTLRWKEYVVNCSLCTEYDVAHTKTREQAVAQFRASGWKIKDGEWVCCKHADGGKV